MRNLARRRFAARLFSRKARPGGVHGENACSPEDVGGASGYEEFLEALANPSHPEHAEQKQWIGRPFDPGAFDIDEINQRLNARE